MARDESGELQALVEQFVSATSREERQALIEPIIFAWTGQEGDHRPHYQSPIDARRIGALEAFYGYAVDKPRESGQQYALMFDGIFENLMDTVFYQMAGRSHLKPFFANIDWSQDAEAGVWLGDVNGVVGNLFDYAQDNAGDAQDILMDFIQAIRGVNVYNTINVERFRQAVDQFLKTADLSTYSEETLGPVVAATMNASDAADVINGNAGVAPLFLSKVFLEKHRETSVNLQFYGKSHIIVMIVWQSESRLLM